MQNKNVYYTTDKYNDLKDEEIIVEIQNGNEQALTYLLNKYKPLVNNKVGKYFIIKFYYLLFFVFSVLHCQ